MPLDGACVLACIVDSIVQFLELMLTGWGPRCYYYARVPPMKIWSTTRHIVFNGAWHLYGLIDAKKLHRPPHRQTYTNLRLWLLQNSVWRDSPTHFRSRAVWILHHYARSHFKWMEALNRKRMIHILLQVHVRVRVIFIRMYLPLSSCPIQMNDDRETTLNKVWTFSFFCCYHTINMDYVNSIVQQSSFFGSARTDIHFSFDLYCGRDFVPIRMQTIRKIWKT